MAATITTAGKGHLLGVNFNEDLASPEWYIGLIDDTGYVGPAITDTLASHVGWNELALAREFWTPLSGSAGVIQNTTPITFTMTDDVSIRGIFICDADAGNVGILMAIDIFDTVQNLTTGSDLNVTALVSV